MAKIYSREELRTLKACEDERQRLLQKQRDIQQHHDTIHMQIVIDARAGKTNYSIPNYNFVYKDEVIEKLRHSFPDVTIEVRTDTEQRNAHGTITKTSLYIDWS